MKSFLLGLAAKFDALAKRERYLVAVALLGGVLLLHDAPPDPFSWVGVGLIVLGMVLSSLASLPKKANA